MIANYNSDSPGPRGYLDGAITAYTPTASWSSITARAAIGAWAKNSAEWNDFWWGAIDEVRISKISRTSSWISTEYQNENSPGTFYTIGARESPSTSGTIASQVLDTGSAGALWGYLFWSSTTVIGTSITFEVRASDMTFAKDAGHFRAAGGQVQAVEGDVNYHRRDHYSRAPRSQNLVLITLSHLVSTGSSCRSIAERLPLEPGPFFSF